MARNEAEQTMTLRKRIALLVIAVVAGSAVAFFGLRSDGGGDGPLEAGKGFSESGQRLAVGERVSYGHVLITNPGKAPATLESIRLLGVTGGLELLGIRSRTVPDDEGRGVFVGLAGFPPDEWSSTALESNHVVQPATTFSDGQPDEGLELVIGVRATKSGVARARAVEFTYKVGSKRYREVFEGSLYLCAPAEDFTAQTCPGEARGNFDDVNAEVKIP